MIKILTAKQIKALDAHTLQEEPIDSIDLMERACHAFVHWFVQRIEPSMQIGVVCGTGNNGGDGLGIARKLHAAGYAVRTWIVRGGVAESPDFKQNFSRIRNELEIVDITSKTDEDLFAGVDVLIDAIFGSGLSRPIEGIYEHIIGCINKSNTTRIAVDIPSGLLADQPSAGEIVRAHYTVTFQLPKLAFMFPQAHAFTGEWIIVPIGLSKSFIKESETDHFLIKAKDVGKILKPRSRFDHKGVYGHALIVAGSYGKMGAALLSSRAALRAGLGLLTIHSPRCGYSILQTGVPEAMVSVDKDENRFTDCPSLANFSTIAVGPGLGQDPSSIKALKTLLKNFRKPLVIDADALNMLALDKELADLVPENSILTPHPKEFQRLAGQWSNDFERLEKQKELAKRLKSIIVLKGANSSIVSPSGKVYFNSTGNPGMATGGTGDVLTGILAGLLAQNYTPLDTAISGVFLHGLSGDVAIQDKGMNSLIASDVVDFLPQAFLRIGCK